MKKIFYWSPFLTKIATIKSVINSASIIKKKDKHSDIYILNCVGEWNNYEEELKSKNLKIIKLLNFNLHKHLPKTGYFASRVSLIIISFVSIFPLIVTLKKFKPNYFIAHLNTFLIISLSIFFRRVSFLIRISGYPKLHFLRKFLWKNFSRKIFAVICPSESTKKMLQDHKIFEKINLYKIEDPVFNIDDINLKKIKRTNKLLAVGRLTKQKNFSFLIKCFEQLEKKYPDTYILNILGEGEKKEDLQNLINQLNLQDKVNLLGYKKNTNHFYQESFCFILSSLWEDPGFVMIEAAINETFILSSNCPNGPKEFVEDDKAGILFESNNIESFVENFDKMIQLKDEDKDKIINYSKKKAYLYSSEEHFKKINLILK